MHAMVAIAARFDFDPNTISKRESWRRYATQLIVLRATMATTVDVLQALAILCVDLIGGGHSPADWGVRRFILLLPSCIIVHRLTLPLAGTSGFADSVGNSPQLGLRACGFTGRQYYPPIESIIP